MASDAATEALIRAQALTADGVNYGAGWIMNTAAAILVAKLKA